MPPSSASSAAGEGGGTGGTNRKATAAAAAALSAGSHALSQEMAGEAMAAAALADVMLQLFPQVKILTRRIKFAVICCRTSRMVLKLSFISHPHISSGSPAYFPYFSV